MDDSQRRTEASLQEHDDQWASIQPDQTWHPLLPSNTGEMPDPQEQTEESLGWYHEQTVPSQQDQLSWGLPASFSPEPSANQLTHDAWRSAVWGIHTQHLPEAQSAFEQQPDRLSLGTGYTSNDANQDEYHANTVQTESVATGVNPAHMPRDYGLGPDYGQGQPLSITDAASYDPQSVGPEFLGTAEPSGPTQSESNEKSGPQAQQSKRKRSKNLPRFLVKRRDEEWFKHNGKLVPSAEVYGMSAVATMCNVGAIKAKEAVADTGPGEVASVTANTVTWDIELVVS
jgi:hypothetical protein